MLKFGIIGMSEGNGHPYSWSAIMNGYEPDKMEKCPFPVIPEYLAKQKFPKDAIADVRVTHIWTQDKVISGQIAEASRIENVVANLTDMIGKVDGILLARDDAELHWEMSEPFLRAGLPIYIDKPLASSVVEAKRILAAERYPGQIFSCTALKYAREFQLSEEMREEIGAICHIDACVVKDWNKYGIHIVEPVLNLLGNQGDLVAVRTSKSDFSHIVTTEWQSGIQAVFTAMGAAECPIEIRVFGQRGMKTLTFEDTFFSFKAALQEFVNSVKRRTPVLSHDFMLKVADLLERGRKDAG